MKTLILLILSSFALLFFLNHFSEEKTDILKEDKIHVDIAQKNKNNLVPVVKKNFRDKKEEVTNDTYKQISALVKRVMRDAYPSSINKFREVQTLWYQDLYDHLIFLDEATADKRMLSYLTLTLESGEMRKGYDAQYEEDYMRVTKSYDEDEEEALEIAYGWLEVELEKRMTKKHDEELENKNKLFGEDLEDIQNLLENKKEEYQVIYQDDDIYILY